MGLTSKHFKDWLNSFNVDYYEWKSRNVAGEDTFEPKAVLSCYVDETIHRITDFRNEEVISNAQLYIDGDNELIPSIKPEDKFVLNEIDCFPKNFHKFRDEEGNLDVMVVYL